MFYLLKDRVLAHRAVRPGAAEDLAVRHVGGRCGSSSACSASGSAPSSSSAWPSASLTFVGLMVLSVVVNPVFGRYAVLLSVIAGILELVPIIGPIISAIPAVLLAATAGIESVVAALILYTLVQQVENNFLVPKIQGDAVELHPAAVIFAIVIGGALAGLIGAILALPIAAAVP